MLEKIVLVVTDYYKEKINTQSEYEIFEKEMNGHDTILELYSVQEMKKWIKAENNMRNCIEDLVQGIITEKEKCLIFSDDVEMLSYFQEKGCYTIALYHEKVQGILSGTRHAVEGISGIEWEYLYKVYQRFKKEPWYITDTSRCIIREMGAGDLEELYELYSNPEVTRYTEGLFPEKEKEKQYIEDYIENVYEYYGFGTWLIVRKEDGKLIGRAGFNYRPGFEEAELGFMIGYPFWRKGYAYEVCSHLLKIGKEVFELEKMQALVEKENEASKKLLQKLGFIYIEEIELEGHTYQRYLAI